MNTDAANSPMDDATEHDGGGVSGVADRVSWFQESAPVTCLAGRASAEATEATREHAEKLAAWLIRKARARALRCSAHVADSPDATEDPLLILNNLAGTQSEIASDGQ
jgi:hypothetical protein